MNLFGIPIENIPINIYNGVNHPIRLFHMENCVSARKDEFALNSPHSSPYFNIAQEHTLSVKNDYGWCVSCGINNIPFQYPRGLLSEIEILPNADQYDAIIVSSYYANAAREKLLYDANIRDYVDRLFTIVPVYEYEALSTGSKKKVGAVRFNKVIRSQPLSYYSSLISNGGNPSKASIIMSLADNALIVPQYTPNGYIINQLRTFLFSGKEDSSTQTMIFYL